MRAAEIQFRLFNVAGKTVFIKANNALKGNNIYHFNLSNMTAGTYYLEVNNNGKTEHTKFVLAK